MVKTFGNSILLQNITDKDLPKGLPVGSMRTNNLRSNLMHGILCSSCPDPFSLFSDLSPLLWLSWAVFWTMCLYSWATVYSSRFECLVIIRPTRILRLWTKSGKYPQWLSDNWSCKTCCFRVTGGQVYGLVVKKIREGNLECESEHERVISGKERKKWNGYLGGRSDEL